MARVNRYKKGQTAPTQPKVESRTTKKSPLTGLKGKAYWAALRQGRRVTLELKLSFSRSANRFKSIFL